MKLRHGARHLAFPQVKGHLVLAHNSFFRERQVDIWSTELGLDSMPSF